MSKDELLKTRFKVIADYPDNCNKVGDIIAFPEKFPDTYPSEMAGMECTEFYPNGSRYGCKFFEKYPHLFKKLEWWEERELEELPMYVKLVDDGKRIEKVLSWSKENFVYEKKSTRPQVLDNVTVSMSVIQYYEPATEVEYNIS